MAKVYRFTNQRRKALKKAQLISARKRKGKGRGRKLSKNQRRAAIGVLATSGIALTGSAAYARHKISGSQFIVTPGGRSSTPMINIAGVEVPGTRAGVRVSNYGGGDFAVTGTHRNKKGDKQLFAYRHRPLTMDAVKATFGMKIKGAPEKVGEWKPPQSFKYGETPLGYDESAFHQASMLGAKNALTSAGKAHRKVGSRRSRSGSQIRAKHIPYDEMAARTRYYKSIMKKNGIHIDPAHEYYVAAQMRRLKY